MSLQPPKLVVAVSQSSKSFLGCILLTATLARKSIATSNLRSETTARQRAASTASNQTRSHTSFGLQPTLANNDDEAESVHLVYTSDDTDLDIEPLASKRTKKPVFEKQTLKEVVIPSPSFKLPARRGRTVLPSQSPSSDGSALSSVGDQSSEYDTPGTSTAVTPAESLGKATSLAGLAKKSAKGRSMEQGAQTGVSRKRKHEDLLGDALLAQALQEEEFSEEPPTRGIIHRRRANAIKNFDEEDLDHVEMDRSNSLGIGIQPSKRARVGGRSVLPARAARDSAQKSIAEKVSRETMDTNSDDSELSLYDGSDEDLKEFEGFDHSDEEALESDSSAPDLPSTATGADHQATISTSRNSRRVGSSTRWRRNTTYMPRVRFSTHMI